KRFRLILGIGQKTIAKRMGMHPTALTKWEHGRSQPSRETRERALAAIGWTPPSPRASSELPPNEIPLDRNRPIGKTPEVVSWEPARYPPTPRRRPYRPSHVFGIQLKDDEDDSPYFISK